MRSASLGPVGALLGRGRLELLLVGIIALLLGGCTVTSFVGQQYTNFTAYYNKFYNANEAFEKGLRSIEKGTQPVDRTRYLPVFRVPSAGQSAQEFEKAIRKSAGVLREHPDSKWVDDALLLIGKSYFYQQNYIGATQKFREVIALGGERAQEARFWLARTLVATQRYKEAQKEIRLGLQQSEELEAWTARLLLVRGQLLVRQEAWQEAAQALRRGLEGDVPDDVGARGAFLLGQVQETVGNPEAARTAYQQVQKYDPRYALGFAARLNDIELQGIHANTKQALDRLYDVERDDKNYERRGEMAIVRARIYRSQEKYDRAQRTLKNMLYGEEPPSGTSAGRLHYDLARLYRDAYKDFSKAAAHFDTASTSLGGRRRGQEEEDVQRIPAAPIDPGSQADRYQSLAKRAQSVARMDSLLRVGRMSDSEFRAFVADLRRRRQAEQEARAEERQSSRSSMRLRSGGSSSSRGQPREPSSSAADTRTSEAGFLFHNDPARVQQGRRQFKQTWGNRPRVDNWRRRTAIRSAQAASSSEDEASDASASAEGEKGASPIERSAEETEALDLSAIPRDSASLAKMEANRAVARYELANSLFLAASRPDSAATWYRRVLQENGDHPVAKRALYALAEVYRTQGDTTAAQQAYRRLVDRYPDTDLAVRARQRLGRSEERSRDDRTVRADEAYARAYEEWKNGRLDAALPHLLDVAVQYPETDAAPRSLLAAGIVYWHQVQRDSGRAARSVLRRHLQSLRRTDSTQSEGNAPDTVEAEGEASSPSTDSVVASADSTQSPERADSTRAPTSAPQDTLRTTSRNDARSSSPTDSVRVAEDTTAAPAPSATADSTGQGEAAEEKTDVYVPLESLMTHLTKRYSSAPQVNRARSILGLIKERRAPADTARTDTTAQDAVLADTTGQAPSTADTAATDTSEIPEWKRQLQEQREKLQKRREQPQERSDTAAAAASDTVAAASDTVAAAEQDSAQLSRPSGGARKVLPAPTGAIQNPQDSTTTSDIDRSEGGWTLLVQTFSQSRAASVRVSIVGRKVGDRWPVELLKQKTNGETRYRLIVGQFASEEEAAEAREQVAQQIPASPEVWALPASQPRR